MRGKCALKHNQPDESLGRDERVNTLGTCSDLKQNMGQPPTAQTLAEKLALFTISGRVDSGLRKEGCPVLRLKSRLWTLKSGIF